MITYSSFLKCRDNQFHDTCPRAQRADEAFRGDSGQRAPRKCVQSLRKGCNYVDNLRKCLLHRQADLGETKTHLLVLARSRFAKKRYYKHVFGNCLIAGQEREKEKKSKSNERCKTRSLQNSRPSMFCSFYWYESFVAVPDQLQYNNTVAQHAPKFRNSWCAGPDDQALILFFVNGAGAFFTQQNFGMDLRACSMVIHKEQGYHKNCTISSGTVCSY